VDEPERRRGPRLAAGLAGRVRALPVAARAGLAAAVVVVVAVVVALLLSGGHPALPGVIPAKQQPPPATLADAVPYDGRSPTQPGGAEQRVLVELPQQSLGELKDARAMGAAEQLRWIKLLKREGTALRSALNADGIVLRDVVTYFRVFDGFAATVRTSDLGHLNSGGARVRPVRITYPASGEPVPVAVRPAAGPAAPAGQPPVAVLDTGVDSHALGGHADPGYDAVDRDRDPSPGRERSGARQVETSGTALAGVLAAAGERVLPIRVASLRASPGGSVEAAGTTEELLSGLEHAVDPNGDGDTSDHVPVALVGVNAPYAGFDDSPEARAVKGAAGLGTLVVAPAGNEGPAQAGSGTVGSPAAVPGALAVGALEGPEPAARVDLIANGKTLVHAAALGGAPPTGKATAAAGPVTAADPVVLGRQGAKLAGKIVIVRAGANPAAQAAAAAAVGARAVVLAEPRDRTLPAMAAGRAGAPVIGVTGAGARAVLALRPGTAIGFGAVGRGPRSDAPEAPRVSPFTSAGPSAAGRAKPELAAPGSALTLVPGGGGAVVGGTAIAAARVAVAAARLARAHPELSPAELSARLIAAADPAGLPVERAGAGALREPPAAPVTADPPAPDTDALDPVTFQLAATASTVLRLIAGAGTTVQPASLTLRPGAPATVVVRPAHPGAGRLQAIDATGHVVASVPWVVHVPEASAVPLGPLRVTRGRTVRFTLGAFERGDPLGLGTEVRPAARLELDLVGGGATHTLTPFSGARELMPAVYGYTLPAATLATLPHGSYTFRARAWAPGRTQPTERSSAPFRR
jgi:hypothetical protein